MTPELQQVLDGAWKFLHEGIGNPQSRLRTPVLATVDRACSPDARTAVVERLQPEDRKLFVNTDRRSPKFDEILFRPEVVFVFYENDTQIRVRATLEVHSGDVVARHSWEALPADMRALYVTQASPGTPAHQATNGRQPGSDCRAPPLSALESGYAHYAVLEATATQLDWLQISAESHRRATFRWDSEGRTEGSWVFP